MRATRALAVTATAFAAVGLCAPLAAAGGGDGPRNVQVSPSSVFPGGTLTITADGCRRGGTVSSNAFPDATLSPRGDRGGESTATARVRNNAAPGSYHLTVRCNDSSQTASASFTVLPARGAQGGLGGSIGPTSTEMAIGAGLVATAAVGGSVFIARRRRTVSGQV
ncbi:hypothetical protein [Streptomyces genisteinicus]|uniref:Integral membrane protein n=1 Tax=Streptomyces genisteinicus TaxID=2768068 RepID=A0A7H0I1P8_9ACTN|nr:hypothetical protein [Streptomyces genisteinicus]QNP66714.1 hypothetical protein IAG43_29860 [Streptomyces genisteinicus]